MVYVCNCNGLGSRKVAAAIVDGASTYRAVLSECGVKPQCGKCRSEVEALIGRLSPPSSTPTNMHHLQIKEYS
ncbi:bacterioferritin-associated ferredoxin [Thalassospira xianhensis]|uniref:(2Fe-2S)-binding protein n=1 Tax=Thalassospira TaxID=168934 RepID=UPI003622F100